MKIDEARCRHLEERFRAFLDVASNNDAEVVSYFITTVLSREQQMKDLQESYDALRKRAQQQNPWPTEPNPPAKELTIDQLGWPPHATYSNQTDAPSCGSCGNIMQRAGSCYCCSACGTTTGCG